MGKKYYTAISENRDVNYCLHLMFIAPHILYFPVGMFEDICMCLHMCRLNGIHFKEFRFVLIVISYPLCIASQISFYFLFSREDLSK